MFWKMVAVNLHLSASICNRIWTVLADAAAEELDYALPAIVALNAGILYKILVTARRGINRKYPLSLGWMPMGLFSSVTMTWLLGKGSFGYEGQAEMTSIRIVDEDSPLEGLAPYVWNRCSK